MTTRQEAATAVIAAEDTMLLYGRTEAAEKALAEAQVAYWRVVAEDPDSLQAGLARGVGEALERAGAQLTITAERQREILAAYGIPAEAVGAGPVDDLVHWRGLDGQATFTPLGFYRPTRCGLFGVAMLGYPLEHVTCPKCRELAAADEKEN